MQIYTKEGCGFSASLRELLDEREIPYEKVMVQEGTDAYDQLVERTGMKSLPQVFVGSMLLGGYQETLAADQAGMLADLLVD